MHGIVKHPQSELFIHKNMDDWDGFVRHLTEKVTPYVSLEDALAGKGDALTIDDATSAAADAARLARSMGHEVTLFVNPWHVEHNKIYMTVLLNVLFDRIVWERLLFRGTRHFVVSFEQKKIFRGQMREMLCALASPEKAIAEIVACASENEIRLVVPDHLKTISIADILALKDAGIRIQNHGWFHEHHDSLTAEQKKENVEKGSDWLQVLGISGSHYAIPYGVENQLKESPEGNMWYLLDANRPLGLVGKGLLNRKLFSC